MTFREVTPLGGVRLDVTHFFGPFGAFLGGGVYGHGVVLDDLVPEGGATFRFGYGAFLTEFGVGIVGPGEVTVRGRVGVWFPNIVSVTAGVFWTEGYTRFEAMLSVGYGASLD